MKEKIERLSKGIFEYETPKLQLSQTELCILVEIGSKKQGSFFVTTKTKQKIKALLYVTGKVLSLDRYEFIATECEIKYEIDATTLTLGEKYTGIISIISDCEEIHIPFYVDVIEPSYDTSIGKIQNLDQFINLAQVNWKEALFLFQSKGFIKGILQKEERYHLVYEQLKESSDLSHAMEEFLVLIHKKEKCDFLIDVEKLERDINDIQISFILNPETQRPMTCLNDKNVEDRIRNMEVSSRVSLVAALGFVREALVKQQQEMGKNKGIVMDGRDIGTAVFPEAELKIFVTASAEIRAQRRYDELKAKGQEASYDEILANVKERDHIDMTREVSPLRQAEDAILLDNSHLTIEEQKLWLQEQYQKAING